MKSQLISEWRGVPIAPRYPRDHAKAGQVIPTAQPIQFYARYPGDHLLAGQDIERQEECSRCNSMFAQKRVNQAYIDHFSTEHREAFLKLCQVEHGTFWHPARCFFCERHQLDSSEIPPLL